MNNLAFALGQGLASGLFFFSLTYLALSRQLGFKFSNTKILALLLLTAFCIGLIDSMLHPEVNSYLELFSGLGIPLIVSALVIFVAHKVSSRKPVEGALPGDDQIFVRSAAITPVPTHGILKRRWALISIIIFSAVWIAIVFIGREEDNKHIREEATAQLAYNRTYEIFEKTLSDDIQSWAQNECASLSHTLGQSFDAAECVRQAVQNHRGAGYPAPHQLCSMMDHVEQKVGLDTSLRQAARETLGQAGCAPDKASAPPAERPISAYLSKALIPPLGFAALMWAGLAVYSRIRSSRLASSDETPEVMRKVRIGVAMLLVYQFWLGFWVLFIARSNHGSWIYSRNWLQEWLARAVLVPVGLLLSYLAYRWATTNRR